MASGTTATRLSEAGIAHSEVADVTVSPEMLGGRVKTLHPKIHGGILSDGAEAEHLVDLEANGIATIDLVASNLLSPFSSDPSVELCSQLLDAGVPGLHFYTFNISSASREDAALGLGPGSAD